MNKAVRGSPIIRTVIVAIFLTLTALVLGYITQEKPREGAIALPLQQQSAEQLVPFQLQCSAPFTAIALHDAQGLLLFEKKFTQPRSECQAALSALPSALVLTITWQEPLSQPRYFAKLQLDPAGRATMAHVFDGATHLDDIWELP